MNVQTSPLSTFAADVDTASYTQIRSAIENGYDIDPSMVRIEEMLNYFHYDYPLPKGNENSPCIPSMRIVRGIRIQSLP